LRGLDHVPSQSKCNMQSVKYRDSRTGEIVTQFNIMDSKYMEENETDRGKINANKRQKYIAVTEEFAIEMLEVLPPAEWENNNGYQHFLVGEPYTSDAKGNNLYETFTRMSSVATIKDINMVPNQWYYMGLNAVK